MAEENRVIEHESGNADQNAGGLVSLVDILSATKPWLLFMGVVGFIACGFIVIAGFVLVFLSPGMGGRNMSGIMGFIYFILAALYYFPSLCLVRAANAIRDMKENAGEEDIYWPLQFLFSFWRYCGIVLIIALMVYAILLLVGLTAILH